MSLNIKNKEAHKLANQLAKLTGENMTEAVTNAVRERLDRVRCQRGSGLADRLIRIGKDCAARLKEPFRSIGACQLLLGQVRKRRSRQSFHPPEKQPQLTILADGVSIERRHFRVEF